MSRRSKSVRAPLALAVALICAGIARTSAAQTDTVLYASDVASWTGNWSRIAATGAAGGYTMSSVDYGWSKTDAALASPADYFEANFTADAGVGYHVWLRLRAQSNTK